MTIVCLSLNGKKMRQSCTTLKMPVSSKKIRSKIPELPNAHVLGSFSSSSHTHSARRSVKADMEMGAGEWWSAPGWELEHPSCPRASSFSGEAEVRQALLKLSVPKCHDCHFLPPWSPLCRHTCIFPDIFNPVPESLMDWATFYFFPQTLNISVLISLWNGVTNQLDEDNDFPLFLQSPPKSF